MRPIPKSLREMLDADPDMHHCARDSDECVGENGEVPGRIEWEHVFYYRKKQLQEWYSILPLCWLHHRGGKLDKELNRYLAMKRMGEDDIEEAQRKYPRFDWKFAHDRLMKKFNHDNMAFEKPEKKSKFKKCPNNKCKRETVFAICEHCGTYVGLAKLPKKKD